jgi:23S rRNA (uracil1939-C5)-methyltransferase
MNRVRRLPGAERATPVFRLDVGTSGLVLFVRAPEDLDAWAKAASGASCRRVYLAAVRGVPPMKGAVTRDLREGGVRYPARTRYRRLASFGGHGMVRAVPEVGRTHQVRRHLAAIGHPVIGDDRYGHGPTNRYFEERHALDRTFLHCVRLELSHPHTGARFVLESPLPGDLRTVLERVGGVEALRFLEMKNALGMTSLPPPPMEGEPSGPLDVDNSSPTIRPEPLGDDNEA